jgi:outer membrane receptor protein involved in Fe transport
VKRALKCFTALTASAAALSFAAGARAQAAPAPSASGQDSPTAVSEIVVTGTPAGSGRAKLDAGFSITTISPKDLEELSPKSTGEVLTQVPGVWVESSGGVGTSNIFVRGIPSTGDAPFVTVQVNGVSVFGMSSPSFMDQTALFRVDETISRVEAVNGGPGSVFSDGQPGLTTNFALKEGHDKTEGELMATGTDYGQRRVDGVLSGKLTDDTYYMIGGYVSSGPSVRDAGFDTEQGRQFTANITHNFERGKLDVFARYTDDHGEWYVPFAIGVPGINLGTYNPLNNYTRYANVPVVGGGTTNLDLGKGRGWKGVVAGGSLNYDLGGGFEFRDRFGVTNGDLDTYGLVADGGAVTVGQVLAANPGLTSVSTVHGGAVLPTTAYLQDYGAWMALKHLNFVSNEMSVSKTIANNNVTLGYYFANFSSDDNWSLGNNEAIEVGGSGDLVNVTATQVAAAYNGGNQNGSPFAIKDSGTDHVNAIYAADSWNVTPQLRIDAAVREEWQSIDFTMTGAASGALKADRSAFSWTVGANYKLTHDMDVYARASEGHHFPSFDDVRSQIGNTGPSLDENWRVTSYEAGYKFHNRSFDADVSVFYDDVNGAVYNDVFVAPTVAGSRTYGVEFDGRWTSDFGFSVTTNDVWEDPKTHDPADKNYDGKQAERIPQYQARITPAYAFEIGEAHANLYGTFMAIGQRWSDLGNTENLPAYQTVSAGLLLDYHNLTFKVAGDNLTDSHGLTEGDPRNLPGAVALSNSRPIFGRSVTFSLGWRF